VRTIIGFITFLEPLVGLVSQEKKKNICFLSQFSSENVKTKEQAKKNIHDTHLHDSKMVNRNSEISFSFPTFVLRLKFRSVFILPFFYFQTS
jgi:hypothetical protein